jgi:hypothetical protein
MAAAPTFGRGVCSQWAGGAETARFLVPTPEFDVAQEPAMTEMAQIELDVEKQPTGHG